MKAAHDQRNRAAANVVPAAAVIIGYAMLTHIYDSKDSSFDCGIFASVFIAATRLSICPSVTLSH